MTAKKQDLLSALRQARRPEPQANNHLVVVILDSCRYDTFIEAAPKNLTRLSGPLECRHSYATWTPPSHYNLLMGLIPHTSPPGVFASDIYKQDFDNYNRRLDTQGIEFSSLIPHLWLPTFLQRLGYTTHARMSMPVLNEKTPLNFDFDTFRLMNNHNDFETVIDSMVFAPDRPSFYFLNLGETHFPYALPEEDPSDWPTVSGEKGLFVPADQKLREGTAIENQRSAPSLRPRTRRRHEAAADSGGATYRPRVRETLGCRPEEYLVRDHVRSWRTLRGGRLLWTWPDPTPAGSQSSLHRRNAQLIDPDSSVTFL